MFPLNDHGDRRLFPVQGKWDLKPQTALKRVGETSAETRMNACDIKGLV